MESAFFARFFRLRMISFSFGSFSMGAYTRYGSASIFHAFSSTPSSVNGFFFLNGGRARLAGSSAGTASPSAVTPRQPPRFLYMRDGVKSGSKIWPRRPMVTHSSPSTSKRYTGVEYTLSAFGFFAPSSEAIFVAASFFSVTTSFTWLPSSSFGPCRPHRSHDCPIRLFTCAGIFARSCITRSA